MRMRTERIPSAHAHREEASVLMKVLATHFWGTLSAHIDADKFAQCAQKKITRTSEINVKLYYPGEQTPPFSSKVM